MRVFVAGAAVGVGGRGGVLFMCCFTFFKKYVFT